jgi:tetratricopeptide (TPR) repeat protein
MNCYPDFNDLLNSSQGPGDRLSVIPPQSLIMGEPSAALAWQLLSGAIALRHSGYSSESNDWFNTSMSVRAQESHPLLRAEQVTLGGLGLFAEKRFADAAEILQGAADQWMDLCQTAVQGTPRNPKRTALAAEIAEMLDALGEGVPAAQAKGAGGTKLVRAWLVGRAVLRRAEVFAAYVRILANAGQHDDARQLCEQEVEWIEGHLTEPVSLKSVPGRSMSRGTRQALYKLALARGEVELAAGSYQLSADSFAHGVKLYDGHVEDLGDTSRMIQAHANQANSLLRLGRYDEALRIYELAQMGFRSIGDNAGAARVEHAMLFARTKKEAASGT